MQLNCDLKSKNGAALKRVSPDCLSSLCPPGFLLFKDFCMNEIDEAVPQLKFYEEVSPKFRVCVCVRLDGIMGWVRD